MPIVCIWEEWKKHFESIFWSDASNQFSSHEDIWFEGRYCLVFGPPDIWIKWVYLYWTSMLTGFCSREHMVFKKKLFKEFQDGWLFYAWPSLIFKWIDLSNDSVSPFCVSLRSNRHLFLKKRYCLKNWRQLPLWHNTMNRSAGGPQSPVKCPTNLASVFYKYADGF